MKIQEKGTGDLDERAISFPKPLPHRSATLLGLCPTAGLRGLLSLPTLCRSTPIATIALRSGVCLDADGATQLRSSHLRRGGALGALPPARRLLSSAPQARHTPPPSPHPQRSDPALWRQPPSSPIRRRGRTRDPPPCSRPGWRVAPGAGVSGWDGSRGASPLWAPKGWTIRRRPLTLGFCCL